ncbi:MAG: tRNA lysidine(34) synthetase TilS [Candidatus Nanopelagicaceae bacterium]|nr:tRNA lysidine(34) synthetase TilS [Candidatus Nanopelagicaceae bacterium]
MDALVALRSAVRATLEKYSAGDLIAVAVSGGADSLALAEVARIEGEKLAQRIVAVTIDHQLQSGSAEQANKVVKQLSIPCSIIKVNVELKDGLEASARRARYEALTNFAKENNASAVLLGHTKDDQAETVLLGLARGSGARSLSGMSQVNGIFERPFLEITREQTVAACKELNFQVWNDPYNENLDFLRVRVRKNVLPIMETELGPGIRDALTRSAHLLRDDADALDAMAEEFWSQDKSLAVEPLAKLPKAVRSRVLRLALFESGVSQLSADQVGQVEALISNWKGQGEVSLPAGVKVSRISGRLTLS